jgi:hypothetical protein
LLPRAGRDPTENGGNEMATCFAVIYRNSMQSKYRCRHFLAENEAIDFADDKRRGEYEVAIDPNQPLSGWVDGEHVCL